MTCAWDYLTFIWKVDPPSVYPCDTTSFQTSEKRDILRGKPCLEPAGRRSQSRVYSICLASVASGSTLAVILVGSNSALVFTNRRHHARHHSPRHPCCKSLRFFVLIIASSKRGQHSFHARVTHAQPVDGTPRISADGHSREYKTHTVFSPRRYGFESSLYKFVKQYSSTVFSTALVQLVPSIRC